MTNPGGTRKENVEWTFSILAGLIIAAHFVASLFPLGRTWGFHHLLFFPLWLRIAVTLTGLVICIPRVCRRTGPLFHVVSTLLFRQKRLERYIAFAFISFLSLLPFWLLRARTHFLGDGYLRVRGLDAGHAFSTVQPLDTYLHFLGHTFFSLFGDPDPATTYALVSCLSGALFVFALLTLSLLWMKKRLYATLIVLSVITMGVVQLFFGYVENYTLMTAGILLYIFTSLLSLQGTCSVFIPSLALGVTICLHTASFPLIGSLAYLVFAKRDFTHKRPLLRPLINSTVGFILPFAGLGGLALHFGYGPKYFLREAGQGIFLPFLGNTGTSPYSLIAPLHVIDFVNEQILISPAGIIAAGALLLLFRRKINVRDHSLHFLVLASACLLIFTFLLNPKLGLSRDWDLFSLPAVPCMILALYLAVSYIKDNQKLRSLGSLLITVSLVHTVPWVLINADEERSVERFKLLIETGTIQTLYYAYEELATYYAHTDRPQDAVDIYRKAIEASPNNWRLHNLLGVALGGLERYDEAIAELEAAKELAPQAQKTSRDSLTLAVLHHNLGTAYARKGLYDEAIAEYEKSVAFNPRNAGAHFYLGCSLWAQDRREEAIAEWRRTLAIDPGHAAARELLSEAIGD